MDWIKIADRLPDYDEYVLWYTISGNYHVECLDKDGNEWLKECTHWMPLPEPPNQIDNNLPIHESKEFDL